MTHDQYGKELFRRAFSVRFNAKPNAVCFGPDQDAGSFRIDGIINDAVAVEIESRTSKQVRGAIVDLVMHPCQKKLLVLIKKSNNSYTEPQYKVLLARLCPDCKTHVVTLSGSGDQPKYEKDIPIVKSAIALLQELG
jgi:hypothetical protein